MKLEGWRHRLAGWLWTSRSPLAQLVRATLLPAALLFRAATVLRSTAYRRGWLVARPLPLPAVAVGNLSVGGTGKTPLASWIAAFYARHGRRPAILLRGYGRDEVLLHGARVPGAVVVPDPDRLAGAERAQAAGADVLVLDDAFQHLEAARDLDIAVISAESLRAAPWPLPAGPWREGRSALARADWIVVTRKQADAHVAAGLAADLERAWPTIPVSVARLGLDHLSGLRTGQRYPPGVLGGKRVLAAAGIADPESYAAQLRDAGASVQLVAYQDHHPYGPRDLERLVRAAGGGEVDYVVITEKDAVKLRDRWPADVREPLVAVLELTWERNGDAIERALDGLFAPCARS